MESDTIYLNQNLSKPPVVIEHFVAALPPAAEEARRTQAIIHDPTFLERIGHDAYEIYATDTLNTFWVIAENYTFRVDIKTLPLENGMVGPGKIVLHFGETIYK